MENKNSIPLLIGEKRLLFSVIIGNPPYQISDCETNNSARPLYNFFVQNAKKLNPEYITIITPSRYFTSGKGLDEFREEMLNDSHITPLYDYPCSLDVFPRTEVMGGVSYFLWDRNNPSKKCRIKTFLLGETYYSERPLHEDGEDIFVRYELALSILKKVRSKNSMAELVSHVSPFKLGSTFKGTANKEKETDVKLFTTSNDPQFKRKIRYCSVDDVKINRHMIHWHKVLVSKHAIGSIGFPDRLLATPIYAEPDSVSTEPFLVIGKLNNKEECESVISYMKTKLFRFLISIRVTSQTISRSGYEYVPIMPWNRIYTDEYLYNHFNLSEKEIAFIEKLIKNMD